MFNLLRLLCASLALFLISNTTNADDWAQWRGAGRDGVWKEDRIIERFTEKQLEPRWRYKIGAGYSGPTVADGRVFVTDRVAEPKELERVHCIDSRSGIKIWSYEYEAPYAIGYAAGPRASVTVDDGRAYSLGAMGHLHCFDAGTGTLLWKHDLNKKYKIRMPIWGIAAAPLVVGDLLIVQVGGSDGACIVAFHKKDGDEQWRALGDKASYSAPILIEQAGQPVVVCWTGENVVGLDPQRGTVHWRHPFTPTQMVINIATPVLHGDFLFVTCFYDGSLMLRLSQDSLSVEKVWRRIGPNEQNTDSLHSIISTPVMQGDYIYGVDSYGELRCLDAATGDRVWENQSATPRNRWSNIHMVKHEDKVWMFNERGELIISKLSPQGFQEISRAKLIEPTLEQLRRHDQGVTWAHPAYADRHVFARSDKELICVSLEAK